jgi:gas vesicle protein
MDYDHEGQVTNFISGLVLGAIIGAGVAMLTAPQSGRRTRRRIQKTAKGMKSTAQDRWEELADDLKGKVDEALAGTRKQLTQ